MKISSLEQMETVVENNKSLEWDGWTVVHYAQSPTAWMKPEGSYKDGIWYIKKHYELNYDGWNIPSKFVGNDAK